MLDLQSTLDRLGVSRRELAKRLGVTPASVNKYVNGNPTAERLEAIAKALNVPIASLFRDSLAIVYGFVYIGGEVHEIRAIGDLQRIYQDHSKEARGDAPPV